MVPSPYFKLFPTGVISVEEVPRWMDLYRVHQQELVVLSEVIAFGQEYRCFCRDGNFICGSSYHLPVPSEVRDFAEGAAQRINDQGISVSP